MDQRVVLTDVVLRDVVLEEGSPREPDGVAGLAFDEDTFARFAAVRQVDLETVDPWTGLVTSSPAWVVGMQGRLYVRSRRGGRRAWFRHLEVEPTLAIWIDGERLPFTVTLVTDAARLELISSVYRTKYGHDPELRRVLHAAAVAATFELHPALV